MNRLHQILVALDQLFNALLGGWADETLSARSYRNSGKKRRWMMIKNAIDALFFWQPNHCFESYLSEMERFQLPAEYRPAPTVQKEAA